MNTSLSLAAMGILVALALWLLGGILLRIGGMLFAVGGLLITATTGSPAMAVGSILGGLAWLGATGCSRCATTTSARRSPAVYFSRPCPGS